VVSKSVTARPAAALVWATGVALLGFAIGRSPLTGGLIVVLAGVVVMMLIRPLFAVSVMIACLYFQGYLDSGIGIVTPVKVVGALAIASWFLDWSVRRRPLTLTPHIWFIGAFLLWLPVTLAVAQDQIGGLVTALRYVTFAALFFLVAQYAAGSRDAAHKLVAVALLAAAISASIGLGTFVAGGTARAGGPLSDPNDFAFLLASTVPLALWSARFARHRWQQAASAIAGILLFGAILATLSRAAFLGLAVAAVWAVATRRLRFRWVALAAIAIVLTGLSIYLVNGEKVRLVVGYKDKIAQQNVDSRYYLWSLALREFEQMPITGVGVGNFAAVSTDYGLPMDFSVALLPTHNAYLAVLSETGLVGFVLFAGYIAVSWATLRKHGRPRDLDDPLMAALAAGFVIALVGSFFATEQYYPPLWLFPALSVAPLTMRGSPDGARPVRAEAEG
jgi:O-antigen ligase